MQGFGIIGLRIAPKPRSHTHHYQQPGWCVTLTIATGSTDPLVVVGTLGSTWKESKTQWERRRPAQDRVVDG